ncbi:MAG: flavin reductase family protein [Acidimicrobiales bacterium]
MTGVDTSEYLQSMAQAATGVTVVTTDGRAGRWGQTVSAMCSVSAQPPTLLVCVNRRSPLVPAVEANGAFSVNVLAAGQAGVADTFAGRPGGGRPYDFACAPWDHLDSGCPGLRGASAVFDCRLEDATDSGTHRVFFGAVVGCRRTPAEPLTYAGRRYGRHAPLVA